jgi:Tfp pilus assembly protein PilV
VDCIVATVLMGVSVAVIIGLAGAALRSQSTGEHLSTAAMLADEQLQLVLARGPDDYKNQHATEGTCDDPFGDYKYKLVLDGGTGAGVPYTVACTITWGGGKMGGSEQSITIDTIIAVRSVTGDTEVTPVRSPRETIDRSGVGTSTTTTTTP